MPHAFFHFQFFFLNKNLLKFRLFRIIKIAMNAFAIVLILALVSYSDSLAESQNGDECSTSEDCYPTNTFKNVCCVKTKLPGHCCDMFSYIWLNP